MKETIKHIGLAISELEAGAEERFPTPQATWMRTGAHLLRAAVAYLSRGLGWHGDPFP